MTADERQFLLTAAWMFMRHGQPARARTVCEALVEEDSRILADSIARSLAVLRAARLLSPWELADMLSPIRLAASMGFIDGIDKEEIDNFTLGQFDEPPDSLDTPEEERARDRRDAQFADRMNKRFARVGLNATGRKLLET